MDIIESMDPVAFGEYLKKYQNTICGRHPIGVLLNVSWKRAIIGVLFRGIDWEFHGVKFVYFCRHLVLFSWSEKLKTLLLLVPAGCDSVAPERKRAHLLAQVRQVRAV